MSLPGVTLVFPAGKSNNLTTSDLSLDGLEVRELRGELRGTGIGSWGGRTIQGDRTSLDRTGDLVKRTNLAKVPAGLEGLLCEKDEWLAGSVGAIYRSKDEGETWQREDVATRGEHIVAIVRFGGRLWTAGACGGLSWQGDDGVWQMCQRPNEPPFKSVMYGLTEPYPRIALTRFRVIDERLYVLGQGLWRIDAETKTASHELESPSLLVDLAKTEEGTLLAVGLHGALDRREKGASWSKLEGADHHVGIVPMDGGLLLVATRSMRWSEDDGRTFAALETGIDLGDEDTARYHLAIADGHGGALVAGWRGLLVRVSRDGLGPWKSAKPAKKTKRGVEAPAPEKPREKDPAAEARMLADVLASPDDDAPRLVYADWLTEHADPRGEFIQLQCMLKHRRFGGSFAQHGGAPQHPDHIKLGAREEALLKKHSKEWLAPVREFFHQWSWERGFLSRIVSNAKFFAGVKEILRLHPLTHLELGGLKKKDYASVAAMDFGTIRWLNLQEQRLNAKDVGILLGKNLANIETLLLWANPLGDEGVVDLATKSHLTKLRELSLINCEFGDEAVEAIAKSPIFANLELLSIRTPAVTADGLRALARSATLTKLQHVRHQLDPGVDADAIAELRARLAPGWNQRRWEPYSSPERLAV